MKIKKSSLFVIVLTVLLLTGLVVAEVVLGAGVHQATTVTGTTILAGPELLNVAEPEIAARTSRVDSVSIGPFNSNVGRASGWIVLTGPPTEW